MTEIPTVYEVLGLPISLREEAVIPSQTLRGAYKRALLKNHPDKSKHVVNGPNPVYTVDQISSAFATLADPATRREYDRQLRLQSNVAKVTGNEGEVFKTGVEILDLDDLEEDETQNLWYRDCRCGDPRGFTIAEADLEEAADEGELSVGCRGCSLWIKVLFGIIEEESTQVENDKAGSK